MGNQLAAPQKLSSDVGELPVVVKDTLGELGPRRQNTHLLTTQTHIYFSMHSRQSGACLIPDASCNGVRSHSAT